MCGGVWCASPPLCLGWDTTVFSVTPQKSQAGSSSASSSGAQGDKMTGATAKPKVPVPEPWTCQAPGCTHGPEGGPFQTQRHRSRMAHLEEMQIHMCCLHPGMLQSTRAAAGASAPPAPAPVVFLDPKSCEFPGCTWSTPAGQFVAISERQAELQLHITMNHSGGSGTGGGATGGKCQTQTKVDRPTLKAKTSATEWPQCSHSAVGVSLQRDSYRAHQRGLREGKDCGGAA